MNRTDANGRVIRIPVEDAVRGAAAFLTQRSRTERSALEEILANPVIWGAALGHAPNRIRTACAAELRRLDQVAA